jgi:hypothetical protein
MIRLCRRGPWWVAERNGVVHPSPFTTVVDVWRVQWWAERTWEGEAIEIEPGGAVPEPMRVRW